MTTLSQVTFGHEGQPLTMLDSILQVSVPQTAMQSVGAQSTTSHGRIIVGIGESGFVVDIVVDIGGTGFVVDIGGSGLRANAALMRREMKSILQMCHYYLIYTQIWGFRGISVLSGTTTKS